MYQLYCTNEFSAQQSAHGNKAGIKGIDMASIAELRAQAADLLAKAEEQEINEKNKLFDGMVEKLEKAGYSIQDFLDHAGHKVKGKKKSPIAGSKLPVKYKNGEHEWTGRGRSPQWIKDIVESGRNKEEFLVK
jgi:DNA-binding protein H-NS